MSDGDVLKFLDNQVVTMRCENSKSIAYYYKLANELHLQAQMYAADQDMEREYVVLKKFVTLVLRTISEHNSYQNKTFAKEKNLTKSQCAAALDKLSELKILLLAKYDSTEDDTGGAAADPVEEALPPATNPVAAATSTTATTAAPASTTTTGGGASDSKLKYSRTEPVKSTNWDNLRSTPAPASKSVATTGTAAATSTTTAKSMYQTIAKTGDTKTTPTAVKSPTTTTTTTTATVNGKPPAAAAAPVVKRKPPPLPKHLFEAKRPLYIPMTLMQDFATLATPNTTANVETCGILCGVIDTKTASAGGSGGGGKGGQPRLMITHCIIPVQHGTSDTCVTAGEEALIAVQDKYNLLTLGWIHTHPSQSCFLSSIDMHTQFSYQIMLPEAVAIVLSPCYNPNTGCFAMTPKGLQILSACDRAGFHQHSVNEGLYDAANHVLYDSQSKCVFVDLRNNSGSAPAAAAASATRR